MYRNNFDVSLNSANGFPVFATVLEANYVNKKRDVFASFRLTEEDHKEILRLSKDENIGKRVSIFSFDFFPAVKWIRANANIFSSFVHRSSRVSHLQFMDTRTSRPPSPFRYLEVFQRIHKESIDSVEILTC